MKYITIFEGYSPEHRFCKQIDVVSRTIQDAIVDIPSLMREFNFKLDDLFDRFNNGLLFESEIGVFVDELNEKELKEFNAKLARQQELEAEQKREAELFEQFKLSMAQKVKESRETPKESASVPSGQTQDRSASE